MFLYIHREKSPLFIVEGTNAMKSFASISPEESAVIRMAWEDRTTFDEIKARTGLSEAQVISLMRRCLSGSSFRMWRKRVHGRVTKHRQRLLHRLNPVDSDIAQDDALDNLQA